jgi:hypothetical protein
MPSNPNGPQPFPCGGEGQMPCPPQPASAQAMSTAGGSYLYTYDEMWTYGKACYDKGRADQANKDAK